MGPFRLLHVLGTGGMGTVYLAVMTESMSWAAEGSHVAVKVVHQKVLRSPEGFQRFLRERDLGTRIRNPNVVRIHHAGAEADEFLTWHYLVMEFVEGRNLADILDDAGALPEPLVRALGVAVAMGLAALHAERATHRDLKPLNVMLTSDDHVKLMDLGAAWVEGPDSLTSSGVFFGTALYGAPEQFLGTGIGPACDQYALGLLLREAITGRRLFTGLSRDAVRHAHVEIVPPPVRELLPDVSPFLDEVISTLLEKDPGRRFESAAVVAEVLDDGEGSAWWRERSEGGRDEVGGRSRSRLLPPGPLIVGRAPVLLMLEHALEETAGGVVGLVVLQGEAGIGKTRLLAEAERLATSGGRRFLVAKGAGVATGTSGARGLTAAVAAALGANPSGRLRHLLPGAPAVAAALLPHVAPLTGRPDSGSQASPEVVQAALVQVCLALAAERPLLILLDDLHAAGDSAWQHVTALSLVAPSLPILIVAATRPGLPAAVLAAWRRLPRFREESLHRLDEAAVAQLLSELLASPRLARSLAPAVTRRSDGNPLFVRELVRALLEGDALAGAGEQGTTDAEGLLRRVGVPDSVQDLLRARLDALPESDRMLLDIAAVQGIVFDDHLVSAALSLPRLVTLQNLARLERRGGLFRSSGASFTFEHQHLRDILLTDLPAALAREYHGLLAAAREEREGLSTDPTSVAAPAAATFLASHHLRGPEPQRGLRFALQGLEYLRSLYRSDELLELSELILTAVPADQPLLACDVHLQRAHCLERIGRWVEARESGEAAALLARGAGDLGREAAGCSLAGRARLQLGDREGARASADAGLAAARTAGDRTREAVLLDLRATMLRRRGENAEARACLQEALTILRELGDTRHEAHSLSLLGVLELAAGDALAARATQELSLALARRVGDPWIEAQANNNLGNVQLAIGEPVEARRCMQQALELAREIAFRQGEITAVGNLGMVSLQLGDYDAAAQSYAAALEAREDLATPAGRADLVLALGLVDVARGDFLQAERQAERSLALAVEAEDGRAAAAARSLAGLLALGLGRIEEARSLLEGSLDAFLRLGLRAYEAHALERCAELERFVGDRAAARDLHGRSLALRRVLGRAAEVASSLLALGRLLAEDGDAVAAAALLEEAATLSTGRLLADPGPLPAAWLARLGRRDAGAVAVPGNSPVLVRAEAHAVLACAGTTADHGARSTALVADVAGRLDPVARATFLTRGSPAHFPRRE